MSSTANANSAALSDNAAAHTSAATNQRVFSDLDIVDLSPLPPAHGFSNARSASLERIPSLKLNVTPGTGPSYQASSIVGASPALSAAPSSFRLEASPPSSPQASRSPRQHPHSYPQQQTSTQHDIASASQPSSLPPPQQHPVDSDTHYNIPADQAQSQMPSVTVPCPSARYVTVSAILSRSEMYYAPDTSDHWDILRSPQGFPIDAQPSHTRSLSLGSYEPSSSLRRRRSQRKRPSNGSAIEALGALLLHKDSSGRVANLSFARDEHSGIRAPKTQSADSQTGRQDPSPKHGVQAWTSALSSLGRSGLRLQLPYRGNLQPFSSSKSATIAERRAQMCDRMLTRQGAVVEDTRNGFSKVRSRRGGLSFEVGNASHKQTPSTLLQLEDYRPEGKGKMTGLGSYDELGNDDELILQAGIDTKTNEASIDWGRLPETIVLKAGRRPRPGQHSRSEFGIGSAVHDQTLPEAPPSPVAMPGAWHGGSSWRSKPGDGYEEGALLLPPPLLDDNGSDASSFEGLLGVRRMREREKARKQAEKLAARNRPTHKVGPLTALTNFVKAAHAAESFAKRTQAARRSPQAPAYFRSFTEPKRPPRVRSGSTGSLSSAQTTKLPKEDPDDAPKMLKSELADITLSALPTSLATAAVTPAATDTEAHTSPAVNSASPFMSPSLRKAILSRRGSRNNSIDAAGRQLNTVFEFEPLDPSQIPDDELASPDLPPISSPLLRPSSISSSKTTALRDFPAAPRLLPVQLSMPPSPFTPLGIDLREPRSSIGPAASSNGDYLSARNVHSSPRTPHLVPTMLSLPPSPWTPYQHASAMHSSPMVHLHLNTSSSSLRLAPGTPRLVPTHIEIVPSPVQTTASSHRGSLTYDSPRGMRAIGMTRSPLTGPATDYTSFAALSVPEAESIDSESGGGPTPSTAQDGTAENKPPSKSAETKKGSLRLTPSSMLVAAQSAHAPIAEMRSDSKNTGVSNTSPTTNASKEAMPPGDRKIKSSDSRSRRSSADHGTFHVDSSGRQRSFVLWFLIGDLGLRGSTNLSSSGNQEAGPDHGGVAALFVHTFSFLVFVAAHLVDLGYSLYERISLFLWFLRWILYNLTGQTVLAQCAVEAYCFIQAEWATVAMEDHEEKGSMKAFDHQGHRKPKGLSRWQVLRGFLELYCLHSVTRERYLAEGAGLKELDEWRRPSTRFQKSKEQKLRGSDRLDIGAHRAASRAAFAENRTKWAQDPMLDFEQQQYETADFDTARSDPLGDGEVSRPGSDVRSRPESDRSSGGEDDCRHDEDDANDVENEDEGDDSSDDEMIVTNRGDDILEFAKTPRIDATRPGQASTGYFGRAYDFMTSPEVSASLSKSENRDLRPFKETNRDLVRTIKWCGRLAISAYGLHVHIVDLPPTFTPSGDRFSRQTFAYLSRLNAEDVLHADIQTLDADADYSPTFYIVRDYVRKVVCVAVRGTQSFSDIIVDLELQTEEIELPQVQPTPGEEFRCHAGIWRAAKALVSPQSKLFATLRQALAENEGFGVMFCGHSLGGAIASAAALLLAEYFIPDGAEPDAGIWVTNMSSGLPARRPIRAVSFASPVTMTADLASRAALGSVPLVTTVVLGSDVIPRVGHGQVRELRRVLGALSRVRRRHAMASTEGQDDARVHILRSFWDWRSIRMAENPDDVMLHRKERIEEQLWSLRCEVESDLYAAIKARLDAESTSGAPIPPSPWVGPEQRDQAPLHALSARRQGLDTATLRSEAAQGGPLVPPGRCIWINDKHIYHVESPLAFFSLPELRGDMFAAHFPAAYEEAILELRT